MLQISGYNCLRDTNLKTPLFSRNASSSNCGKLSALLLLLLLLLPDTVTIGAHPQVKILCTTPDFRQHPQKRPSDQLSTKTQKWDFFAVPTSTPCMYVCNRECLCLCRRSDSTKWGQACSPNLKLHDDDDNDTEHPSSLLLLLVRENAPPASRNLWSRLF
jgi:hypothetical protein